MSKHYNMHEAKTQFSKLVAAVEAGEKVTICRNGVPVVECVPVEPTKRKPFPFGAWAAPGIGDLSYMAEPTDDETLDSMGL